MIDARHTITSARGGRGGVRARSAWPLALAAAAATGALALPVAPASAGPAPGRRAKAFTTPPKDTARRGKLVPGTPVAVLACDYRPIPVVPPADGAQDPGTASGEDAPLALALARSGSSRRAAVARGLAQKANRLGELPPVLRCPSDDGSLTVLTFRFRRGPSRTVLLSRSGCKLVSRGKIVRQTAGVTGKRFVRAVDALLR